MNNQADPNSEKITHIRILLFGLMLALIIGMVGLGKGIKNIQQDVINKDIQINSMAEEIGQLKEENQYLYQNLLVNRNTVTETFNVLQNSFTEIAQDGESQIVTISNGFAKAKEDLTKLVTEKENAINSLQQKNERLMKEVNLETYSSDIFTTLILGTNENLTDTIILAAVNPSKETVTLISIPRDLYVNGRKVNSIYASYGIDKIKQDVTRISGLEIDKYIIFDLDAFEEVIDILGGIDLYVHESIYDPYFPTASNGYTEYSIEEGSHHMNGAEALMYARSRKTTSDFDRSKRQQQVIQAIRVKVKMLNLLSDLDKAIELYKLAIEKVQTDIDVFEALHYLENYQNYAIESGNVISTENLLYSSRTVDGQYILLPISGDYVDIKESISALIMN